MAAWLQITQRITHMYASLLTSIRVLTSSNQFVLSWSGNKSQDRVLATLRISFGLSSWITLSAWGWRQVPFIPALISERLSIKRSAWWCWNDVLCCESYSTQWFHSDPQILVRSRFALWWISVVATQTGNLHFWLGSVFSLFPLKWISTRRHILFLLVNISFLLSASWPYHYTLYGFQHFQTIKQPLSG